MTSRKISRLYSSFFSLKAHMHLCMYIFCSSFIRTEPSIYMHVQDKLTKISGENVQKIQYVGNFIFMRPIVCMYLSKLQVNSLARREQCLTFTCSTIIPHFFCLAGFTCTGKYLQHIISYYVIRLHS